MSNIVTIFEDAKTGQLKVTIPKAIGGLKGWKGGTRLEFVEDRFKELVLKEVV